MGASRDESRAAAGKRRHVTIYTDGACTGNPGPGGWGVVLLHGRHRKELSGGCRRTTNNRMEITAAIEGLRALTEPCRVTLYSDSEYLVKAMMEGWAEQWRSRGWRRKGRGRPPAANADLWKRLLELSGQHDVTYRWVRGHEGNRENEFADALAVEAAQRPHLPPDRPYEEGRTELGDPPLI